MYSYLDVSMLCELYPEEASALTEILRECHSKIGNSDGIHGCGYMHLLDVPTEIQHYEHEENWSLSMLHHDVQLSVGNKIFEPGLINSLDQFGMFYTLNSLIKSNNYDFNQVSSLQYKCSALLSDWSLLDSSYKTNRDIRTDCFEKCYYFALKALRNEDFVIFKNEIYKARKIVLNELANCSLESTKNLYLPMTELQSLKELEEFASIGRTSSKQSLWSLYHKWRQQDAIKCSEFKLTESILNKRIIFLKSALEKCEGSNLKSDLNLILYDVYYKLVVSARKDKKYHTAIRTLSYLNLGNLVPEEVAQKFKIEKARILWETGKRDVGRFLLSHFIKKNEITGEFKAKGLRIYGDWMAESKSENSKEIIQNYYQKSIVQSNTSENLIDSYASLAKFADSNYEHLNEYLSSPLFEMKQNLINTQQGLASELRQELGWNQSREKKIAYMIASKQSAIDETEIKNSKAERDSYLNVALKYYLLTLKEGEKYNLLVFRVISMWLSNANNYEVNQQLKKILNQIPTYKFLCLLPQLIPRMGDICLISDLIGND